MREYRQSLVLRLRLDIRDKIWILLAILVVHILPASASAPPFFPLRMRIQQRERWTDTCSQRWEEYHGYLMTRFHRGIQVCPLQQRLGASYLSALSSLHRYGTDRPRFRTRNTAVTQNSCARAVIAVADRAASSSFPANRKPVRSATHGFLHSSHSHYGKLYDAALGISKLSTTETAKGFQQKQLIIPLEDGPGEGEYLLQAS